VTFVLFNRADVLKFIDGTKGKENDLQGTRNCVRKVTKLTS
jgi:hypothetical protein